MSLEDERLNVKPLTALDCDIFTKIDMQPTGQKRFDIVIQGLKIFTKPQIFMMVKAYFMNAFPFYTHQSRDKPGGFNDDPEKAAQMDTSVILKDNLILFYNTPKFKSIACEGTIEFEMNRGHIKAKKEVISQKLAEKEQRQ